LKKPSQQSLMALGLAIMTFATSYLGYDKYEQSQEPTSVTVNVESMPANNHAHRSTENIQAMIDKAVKAGLEAHEHGEKFH